MLYQQTKNMGVLFTTLFLSLFLTACLEGKKETTPTPEEPSVTTKKVAIPVDFEETSLTYNFIDFSGGSAVVVDNTKTGNTSMKVAQMVKDGGEVYGGSTLALDTAIDFTTKKSFSMKVWAARAVPVLFKLEGTTETEVTANHTGGSVWQELIFDFSTKSPENLGAVKKITIIFDNGVVGAHSTDPDNWLFFFDDIKQAVGTGTSVTTISLPVDFESTTLDYELTDFGGTSSSIVTDPVVATNKVVETIKSNTAETWAGTTVADTSGFSEKIPFSATATRMTVRVYSPEVGIKVRLKVEDKDDDTISVETDATTTNSNTWETLTFDFASQATGTAALDVTRTYNKASIFFDFGTAGATAGEKTYYWDDLTFIGGGGIETTTSSISLPVDFESTTLDYELTDFGGTSSSIVTDPVVGTNKVVETIKSNTAETWAGTTVADTSGFSEKIPFSATATRMTVRVYSPEVGIKVRLKVEDKDDHTISVETDATTTNSNTWETLTFDFASQATGTAALDVTRTYNKASIFFDFGTAGATAGEKTYYWDDLTFIGGGGTGTATTSPISLPVDFESTTLNYELTDFGGTSSSIVTDPVVGTNKVVETIKSNTAEFWAGTTVANTSGFSEKIPFSATATTMTVRVYSPDVGIKVRLKVEDKDVDTITVETDAYTTTSNAWETLTFNFANAATNDGHPTAELDVTKTYNKASIFFNFGTTGATDGEKTYYWDDVTFVSP